MTSEPVPVPPPWKRDFPYEAQSEEEVTRREFARYLVLGAGTIAVANVGLAVWTQLRSINAGEPRAIVPLARRRRRAAPVPQPPELAGWGFRRP